MEIEKVNNKELIPLEHYLEEMKKADPQEIVSRTGVAFDSERSVFTLRFLHREYEITFPEFEIKATDGKEDFSALLLTNQAKILVARFLLEDSTTEGTGKFLTYRDVPWGEVYYRQFNGRCMKRMEFSYGTSEAKLEQFSAKMEKLGAKKVDGSQDAGYEFEVFPGFFVQFLIWVGDEEFPPSSQILFSDNFALSFHAEDLVVVAEVALTTLKNL